MSQNLKLNLHAIACTLGLLLCAVMLIAIPAAIAQYHAKPTPITQEIVEDIQDIDCESNTLNTEDREGCNAAE